MYSVKEIFYTLQGEGANTGTPAVFCRFAGCNLWSGREEDRADAACNFCDTDFVGTDGPGGGKFAAADDLARAVESKWTPIEGSDSSIRDPSIRFVVCTGGEPLLQLDRALIDAFHARGFRIAIETNGTQPVPPGIDWVCVSPKATAALVVEKGDELKLVYPQADAQPGRFEALAFAHFFLQPMDGPARAANTRAAIDYCLAHPRWRLSLQTHKIVGIA
jgi:7-carboxy-7-deazaguanine synthase (Cx14CxxC type)